MKRLAVGLVALGGATLSCQVIMGLHDPEGNNPPPVIVDSGPKDPCGHAGPPPPPLKDDDVNTKKAFWFATKSLTLPLAPDAGVQPGFDLDNACTCAADFHDGGPSCRSPMPTLQTAGPPASCDYDGGIDDGFGKAILGSGVSQYVDVATPINNALGDGTRTLLLWLGDYNDQANDSDVSVEFVDSGGLYTSLGCDGQDQGNPVTFEDTSVFSPPPPGPKRYAPLNKGCDRWSPNLNTTTQTGSLQDQVPNQTLPAYVTNYTIVMKYDKLSGSIFGGSSTISNGIAIATIRKEGNIHYADGFFSGRVPFTGLLDLLSRTPVEDIGSTDGGKVPFCDSPFFGTVVQYTCGAQDTMFSKSADFQDQACDATSLQFAFSLVEAQVDQPYTSPLVGIQCTSQTPACPAPPPP